MRVLFFVSLLAFANGQAHQPRDGGAQEAFTDAVSRMLKVVEGIISDLEMAKHEKDTLCTKDAELSDGALASTQADLDRYKGKVSQLEASIVRDSADADALAQQIQKDSNTLTAKEQEKKTATATRESENATFTSKLNEMADIVQTIRGAIAALDTQGAVLLQGKPEQAVMKSIPAIKAVVSALSLTTQSNKKLEALVQASEEGGDDFGEYVSRGSDVLSLLHGLQDDANDAYAALKATEANDLFEHNALVQQLNNEMQTLQDAITQNRQSEAMKRAAIAADNASLEVARTNQNSSAALLAELKANGAIAEKECEEYLQDATTEIDALKEALSVLGNDATQAASQKAQRANDELGLTGFVQLSTHSTSYKDTETADKARAARFLSDMADRLASPVLAQIGEKVADGKFDFVIRMIEDMLVKLDSIASVDDWCKQQLAADDHQKNHKQMKVDKAQTAYERLMAEVQQIKQDLSDCVQAQNTKQQELTALGAQRAAAQRSNNDTTRALDSVTGAFDTSLEVLEKYYADNPGSKAKKGQSVIEMLRNELTQIKRQTIKWQAIESTDDRSFKKMKADIEADIQGQQKQEKLLRKEGVEKRAALAQQEAELHDLQVQLGAMAGLMETQTKDCQVAQVNDEDRMRRAEKEKLALQEALAILKSEGEVWTTNG